MSVRSHRLAGPVRVAGAAAVELFTVPDGYTALVKSTRAVNIGAAAATWDLCLDVADDEHALLWGAEVSMPGVFADSVWWVMHAGETLLARVTEPGELTITVSGALLREGVA